MNCHDIHITGDFHTKLFGFVRQEASVPAGPWDGYGYPTFEQARELIREHTDLKKEPETGLWYHAHDRLDRHLARYTHGWSPGYFRVFWPSGRLMAQILAEDRRASLTADRCVLSIGPGSGLAEIHLVKKRKPRLMACYDKDVFARAALELNAAANDVQPGEKLVTITHADALKPIADGAKTYRLFDTVLAADCLYDQMSRGEEVRGIAASLKGLQQQGAEVVIADRDSVKLCGKLGRMDRRDAYRKFRDEIGLRSEHLMAKAEVAIDNEALGVIMLKVVGYTQEPVIIHHWPARSEEHTSELQSRL